jgi:hypothetical protein
MYLEVEERGNMIRRVWLRVEDRLLSMMGAKHLLGPLLFVQLMIILESKVKLTLINVNVR